MNTTDHTQHQDVLRMKQALGLARNALWITSPNPRVGCVLVGASGEIIGIGSTQAAGQAHAEVMALKDAAIKGKSAQGATAYVTLEPCAHQGRTGPCCDALISAGVARVVASLQDPNPLVGGQGFERLKAAGVEVNVGLGAEESRELNLGFLSRLIRKRPWVRMKIAASLDGATALRNGQSQWITGPEARADGHLWRARACAVMTGSGTVLADNPVLNVRGVATPRQPHLVLIDSSLRTPLNAALWSEERKVFVYGANDVDGRQHALTKHSAVVKLLQGAPCKVDLAAVMHELAMQEINELHVEAGYTLSGALLDAGLVDELLVYMAPKLLGSGKGMALLQEKLALSEALQLHFRDVQLVGEDVRLLARVAGSDAF
jgi:diaminohydroxyphosphoribosylaminopyrimidine deaminase/5-amino-6-(5-phosphoribosylamino)uracil reductase